MVTRQRGGPPSGQPRGTPYVTGDKPAAGAKFSADDVDYSLRQAKDGTIEHVAKSPNGITVAVRDADGNLRGVRSDTAEGSMGNGEGTARVERLAQEAHSMGKSWLSDKNVSEDAQRPYNSLKKRGYEVIEHPNEEQINGEKHATGKSVFEVRPKLSKALT